jgi:hypothetical protein
MGMGQTTASVFWRQADAHFASVCLPETFRRWRAAASELRAHGAKLRVAVRLWRNRAAGAAWEAWLEWTAARHAKKALVRRIPRILCMTAK